MIVEHSQCQTLKTARRNPRRQYRGGTETLRITHSTGSRVTTFLLRLAAAAGVGLHLDGQE
jgi:hypothetical protein